MSCFYGKFLPVFIIFLCFTGCGRKEVKNDTEKTENVEREIKSDAEKVENREAGHETATAGPTGQTEDACFCEYIGEVPIQYFENCDKKGSVSKVSYKSKDYTSDKRKIVKKTAFVYLPYGYDGNDKQKRYDVLYLMHGWKMTAGDFFDESKSGIINMLDNMTESGDIPPMIVVSATFDIDNKPKDFKESVSEAFVFHRDFVENLIPFIEKRYNNYADDTTDEAFAASRNHRVFGGFSLGAVATWHQFADNLNYIKYFIPISGCCVVEKDNEIIYKPTEIADYLEDVVDKGNWGENDFKVYHGIGTDDTLWEQADSQLKEMSKREKFSPLNMHCGIVEGGGHDLAACERVLYYALRDFFGT